MLSYSPNEIKSAIYFIVKEVFIFALIMFITFFLLDKLVPTFITLQVSLIGFFIISLIAIIILPFAQQDALLIERKIKKDRKEKFFILSFAVVLGGYIMALAPVYDYIAYIVGLIAMVGGWFFATKLLSDKS